MVSKTSQQGMLEKSGSEDQFQQHVGSQVTRAMDCKQVTGTERYRLSFRTEG